MKKIISKRFAIFLSVPMFLFMMGTAKAETVTVDFSGTIGIITDTYGDLAAVGIQSGVTTFSGTVVYDTTTPAHATFPTVAQYWSDSYTVNIGSGFSWSKTPNNGSGVVVQDNRVVGSNTYDMFEVSEAGYASFGSNNVWMQPLVWMKDNSLLSLTSTSLPTASILNNFNIDETFFRIFGYDGTGQRAWDMVASNVSFNITSSVPEPSTLLLLGGGLVGLGFVRRRFKG
jgi:hypothetical protein